MDKKEIEMMLPEYVNERLSTKDAEIVKQAMEQDINIKAEVEFLQHLRKVVKNTEVESPSEWGLARLKRSLPVVEEISKPKTSSWWKPIAVAASFAFVLQTSYMLFNETNVDEGYIPLSTSESENTIQIVFDPNVTETLLRELLTNAEATIISGPSASGVYRIAAKNQAIAIDLLKSSKWVEHVEKE